MHFGGIKIMQRENKRKLLILLILLLLFIIGAGFLLFNREKLHLNYLDYFTGDVAVMKPDKKIESAEIKKKLFNKDRVITGDESKAYIQLDRYHLVELDSNTELNMESLADNIDSPDGDTILDLIKGKIKAYAQKTVRNGEFKIKAGKSIINIRDSIFSMEHQADVLKIEIKEGSLSITPEGDGEETILSAGEKALITSNNIIKDKMISDDFPAFENIGRLRPIIDIQTATREYIIDYFRIGSFLEDKNLSRKDEPEKSDTTPSADNKNKQKIIEKEKLTTGTRLNVNALIANGVEKSEAADISKLIYSILVSSKGKDKVIYREVDGRSKSANRQLAGRVSKLGNTVIVSVNITDGESGKVLFNQAAAIKENDSIETVLQGLAEKIISAGDIW